jgi:hypothetical protein
MRRKTSSLGDDHPNNSSSEPRDRHGDRGLPPPAEFDIATLPGSALLNERETAAVLRISRSTLEGWRKQIDHPLKWIALPNGFVRYYVSALRAFLALGQSRPRKHRPKPSPAPAANTTAEHSQDSAPPRRRAARPRAKADDLAAPQEQSR